MSCVNLGHGHVLGFVSRRAEGRAPSRPVRVGSLPAGRGLGARKRASSVRPPPAPGAPAPADRRRGPRARRGRLVGRTDRPPGPARGYSVGGALRGAGSVDRGCVFGQGTVNGSESWVPFCHPCASESELQAKPRSALGTTRSPHPRRPVTAACACVCICVCAHACACGSHWGGGFFHSNRKLVSKELFFSRLCSNCLLVRPFPTPRLS